MRYLKAFESTCSWDPNMDKFALAAEIYLKQEANQFNL